MNTTPEQWDRIEAFMVRSRIKRLTVQIKKARQRGSIKTLVPVELLEALLETKGV